MTRPALVNWALVLVVVVLAALPLVLVDGEFGGADGVAVEQIDATGYRPWSAPLFEPAAETASGLFALQAAIGAGVLGYALGVFRTRSRLRATAEPEGPRDEPRG
jgi:cobalt/nickel transport protein